MENVKRDILSVLKKFGILLGVSVLAFGGWLTYQAVVGEQIDTVRGQEETAASSLAAAPSRDIKTAKMAERFGLAGYLDSPEVSRNLDSAGVDLFTEGGGSVDEQARLCAQQGGVWLPILKGRQSRSCHESTVNSLTEAKSLARSALMRSVNGACIDRQRFESGSESLFDQMFPTASQTLLSDAVALTKSNCIPTANEKALVAELKRERESRAAQGPETNSPAPVLAKP